MRGVSIFSCRIPIAIADTKWSFSWDDHINQRKWFGRENEAIGLYSFGFLQKEAVPAGPLTDPTQIGIEVGTADTPKSPKSQVRKDLVDCTNHS